MSFWEKRRGRIWNNDQHPYRHSGADIAYVNPAAPSVIDVEQSLNYLFSIVRPNAQPAVNTPADLPLAGNVLGDARVVLDDGDGGQAGYIWEQREGDAAPSWYKVYDVDWSSESILASFIDVTLPLYVSKSGTSDLDNNGDPIIGLYAGQTIYGGDQPNQNLTLNANSGDGVGAQTGFVQSDGSFRPTLDDTYDISTLTERWRNGFFSTLLQVGTLSLGPASITDSSGSISFGDENLSTTGNISGAVVTGTSLVADDTTNTMTLAPGSITDSTGLISFGASNLTTAGSLGAGVATFTQGGESLVIIPLVAGPDRTTISSSTGVIDFINGNLQTTGTVTSGTVSTGQLAVDNLLLDGNTLSSSDVDGDINLSPNGTGSVNLTKGLVALGAAFTGTVGVTGQLNIDNLRFDGNAVSTTDVNGDLSLLPNGTGSTIAASNFLPDTNGTRDLGATALRWGTLYIGTGIHDGTNLVGIGALSSLRNNLFRDAGQTQPAQTGDALFYDAVSGTWLASIPDNEVTHSTLGGVTSGDAGHTQFPMLVGRAGGQTILGGTAANENLILGATSDATKGAVLSQDTLAPETTATFSGGWNGTDLGSASRIWRDIYSTGEHRGLRFENILSTALPAFSAQTLGRVYWATDNAKAYVDTGTGVQVLGVSKFVQDTAWNGTDTQKDIDVSSVITDARNAQWQFMDNVNNFEIMGVSITMTSATNVRIVVTTPLPAGSYRLIGLE